MDMTDTIIPNSDQISADDLLTGPRTVTIAEVVRGSAEQPVDVHLVEIPGRPWRPSKSMRRVLVAAWGAEASAYIGRRVTLYRDPEVMFGRDKVGGIKVSHMSDIKGPLKVALTVTRGKRSPFVVQPLADAPAAPIVTLAEVAACTTDAELTALWQIAGPANREAIREAISQRHAELTAAVQDEADHA